MSHTKPTVNERLTGLVMGLQSDLKGLFNNERLNRERLNVIEYDMARLCAKAGLDMTVLENALSAPGVFDVANNEVTDNDEATTNG